MKTITLAKALSIIISLSALTQIGSISFAEEMKNQSSEAVVPVDVAAIQKNINEYTQALQSNLKNDEYYAARGQNYSKLGQFDYAIRDLSQAISLNPARQAYYNSRAIYFGKVAKHRDALRDFDKAIELGPASWDLYQKRAAQKEILHDFTGAVADAKAALQIHPNDWKCLALLAGAEGSIGQVKEAIEHYSSAIKIQPKDPALYQLRGFMYEKQGDKTQAGLDFAKAKQLGYKPSSR